MLQQMFSCTVLPLLLTTLNSFARPSRPPVRLSVCLKSGYRITLSADFHENSGNSRQWYEKRVDLVVEGLGFQSEARAFVVECKSMLQWPVHTSCMSKATCRKEQQVQSNAFDLLLAWTDWVCRVECRRLLSSSTTKQRGAELLAQLEPVVKRHVGRCAQLLLAAAVVAVHSRRRRLFTAQRRPQLASPGVIQHRPVIGRLIDRRLRGSVSTPSVRFVADLPYKSNRWSLSLTSHIFDTKLVTSETLFPANILTTVPSNVDQ